MRRKPRRPEPRQQDAASEASLRRRGAPRTPAGEGPRSRRPGASAHPSASSATVIPCRTVAPPGPRTAQVARSQPWTTSAGPVVTIRWPGRRCWKSSITARISSCPAAACGGWAYATGPCSQARSTSRRRSSARRLAPGRRPRRHDLVGWGVCHRAPWSPCRRDDMPRPSRCAIDGGTPRCGVTKPMPEPGLEPGRPEGRRSLSTAGRVRSSTAESGDRDAHGLLASLTRRASTAECGGVC